MSLLREGLAPGDILARSPFLLRFGEESNHGSCFIGSLQAASNELKMSYRAVWCRIKASEERIGVSLVERVGNGSRLTPYAENLMNQYKRLRTILIGESDEVFEDLMVAAFDEREAKQKKKQAKS